MNRPNLLMVQFMTVVESGGNAGLDAEEKAIAVAVGIEFGWMSGPNILTPEGRAFTITGTATPEFVERTLPMVMCDALQKIGKSMGHTKFEREHGIPKGSAVVVLRLAQEITA